MHGLKSLLGAFLIVVMVGGFALAGVGHFGTVEASTDVIGIINSDATWTKANSPYTLTGPVAVNLGVTLTIELGTTVNLNNYYMQVNGTLQARGSSAEKIQFNGGGDRAKIYFTQHSPGWNEQIGSGSIIENAVLTSIEIDINYTSPKIDSNSINGGITLHDSSSIISNNNIVSTEYVAISLSYSSAIISSNTIYNKHTAIASSSDSSIITNNTIIRGVTGIINGRSIVSKNTVYGCDVGIETQSFSTTEQNLITNNIQGIVNRGASIIQNNTIANNTVGIFTHKRSTIVYNNIQNNSEYNIYLAQEARDNINASFNWWGTIDAALISQSIFDNKNDFNLGTVNFTPFLTAPNPEAMPSSTPGSSTPSGSSSAPEVPELLPLIIFAVALLVISALAVAIRLKRKRSPNH